MSSRYHETKEKDSMHVIQLMIILICFLRYINKDDYKMILQRIPILPLHNAYHCGGPLKLIQGLSWVMERTPEKT